MSEELVVDLQAQWLKQSRAAIHNIVGYFRYWTFDAHIGIYRPWWERNLLKLSARQAAETLFKSIFNHVASKKQVRRAEIEMQAMSPCEIFHVLLNAVRQFKLWATEFMLLDKAQWEAVTSPSSWETRYYRSQPYINYCTRRELQILACMRHYKLRDIVHAAPFSNYADLFARGALGKESRVASKDQMSLWSKAARPGEFESFGQELKEPLLSS